MSCHQDQRWRKAALPEWFCPLISFVSGGQKLGFGDQSESLVSPWRSRFSGEENDPLKRLVLSVSGFGRLPGFLCSWTLTFQPLEHDRLQVTKTYIYAFIRLCHSFATNEPFALFQDTLMENSDLCPPLQLIFFFKEKRQNLWYCRFKISRYAADLKSAGILYVLCFWWVDGFLLHFFLGSVYYGVHFLLLLMLAGHKTPVYFLNSFADRMTSWTGSCWKQISKTEADICTPFVLFSVCVYASRLTPLWYMYAQFVRCSFKLCCVFKLFRKEMRWESVKVLLSALVDDKLGFLAPEDYELWLVNIRCICLARTQHSL